MNDLFMTLMEEHFLHFRTPHTMKGVLENFRDVYEWLANNRAIENLIDCFISFSSPWETQVCKCMDYTVGNTRSVLDP